MKAFFNAITRSPKLAALTAALAGAVLVPAALLAWGPSDRPTFTMAHPSDHVTFNSITDNVDVGDERNFVRIREAGAATFQDEVQVQPGKEYDVSVFYHNNAATILNDAEHNYAGIATGAKARVEMPDSAKAGEKVHVTGYVSATNAQPQQVWDEAYMTSASDVALRYVQNSAKVITKGAINGQAVPETLYTTGANLGFNAQDGKVPGCNDFEGWIVFRVKAVAPDFTVEKTVSKVGANAFSKSIAVNAGDKVEYKIQYKNTGSVNQTNVVIKDSLPAGVTYVADTTNVAKGSTGGKYVKLSDNNVATATGINIGTFGPNSNAFVSFQAKVTDASKLPKCGINTLVNTATVETDNGSKSDTANVTVNKVCANVPPELPQTGTTSNILTFLGLGAVTAGLAYAVNSQRLRNLLRR
jgi:uncharacterized repeat protein (TIGR01451 family)/LPXTG-motif cell wall-anchored protein